MADDSGIDPRYAPHFQRGFDPVQHAPAPARRGPVRFEPVRLEGGPPPTAPRVPDPPRMAPILPVEETADVGEPLTSEDPDGPAHATPWDWVLPGVGAGLIVIALLLWASLATDTRVYYGGSGVQDEWLLFLQQARYLLPGPLMTAGAVAVVGGVILQAVRPRR